jgi:hypothetical protein
MLVPYTHITELSTEQKQRLKTFLGSRILEGHAFVQFEGMTLSVNEVRSQQKIWEAESASKRQILHG